MTTGGDASEAAQDTSFTIAVVPDTQNYVSYDHQQAEGFPFDACQQLFTQLRFIADNLRSAGGDIALVTALGDQWNHQSVRIDPAHAARGFNWVPNPRSMPTSRRPTRPAPMRCRRSGRRSSRWWARCRCVWCPATTTTTRCGPTATIPPRQPRASWSQKTPA